MVPRFLPCLQPFPVAIPDTLEQGFVAGLYRSRVNLYFFVINHLGDFFECLRAFALVAHSRDQSEAPTSSCPLVLERAGMRLLSK